jgi:hypothetical protein
MFLVVLSARFRSTRGQTRGPVGESSTFSAAPQKRSGADPCARRCRDDRGYAALVARRSPPNTSCSHQCSVAAMRSHLRKPSFLSI